MSTTKVITGKVRFSYVNIFKSRAFQADQDAKYSVCLLIPKEDKATIKKIKAAIDAAVQDGISSKWGGKKPANLKQPLRDGDAERADEAPEYEGMYFLNCNSTQKPGIVDKDLSEMAKIYASLIKKGLKTIDDVPENLRDEVRALLEE